MSLIFTEQKKKKKKKNLYLKQIFFKKITDTKGKFHTKIGTTKEKTGMNITEKY